MYVCGWMDRWMYGWTEGRACICIMYVRMDVGRYVLCMYVFMYVYTEIFMCVSECYYVLH